MDRKRLLSGLIAAAATMALLAGCGGGGSSHDGSSTTTPPPTTTPPTILDAFIDAVNLVINGTAEDTEPSSTDNVTATTPEDKEPRTL
ncbi:hypothetical protein IP91_00622 [Pseudoduganella lurida]|uniref:Uncharacterized protein n=1 Tax=Pseudoduganella lurida TaxID=1036180 RepID=A0A562RKI5_9BURK|nr:hypothetical protein [Pseudoduganella lurida]TWI69552.1 hypothetical protein IP91_00622 [Pseudoduganella lurida]